MSNKKSVVLFSGNGSNLKNLLENNKEIEDKLKYVAAFTNNPNAGGIQICHDFDLEVCVSNGKNINSELSMFLENYNPDLIILAGYMKIIPADIVDKYLGKIINIHPSLLPKYPGLDTHAKVLASKDSFHGATIHFVTRDLDQGPIILQGKYNVPDEADESHLKTLTHNAEYVIYPIVVKWFANGLIKMRDEKFHLNCKVIDTPIVLLID